MHNFLNEQNYNFDLLPKRSSLVNYSVFKELWAPAQFRSFSVKYVCNGTERYTVNGQKYEILKGQYLLANQCSEGWVEIESKDPVHGICIDIAPEMMAEVTASFQRGDTAEPDCELGQFFSSSAFLENHYDGRCTNLGRLLHTLELEMAGSPQEKFQFTQEFFYQMAECILLDHLPVFRQMKGLKHAKMETRKDLYRRVTKGKAFIDEYFCHDFQIESVARWAQMSEYHFFRIFRSVFGISPYQYLLQKRIEHACLLLKSRDFTVTEVALDCGFADIHAFSKAFKKYYGMAPSQIASK